MAHCLGLAVPGKAMLMHQLMPLPMTGWIDFPPGQIGRTRASCPCASGPKWTVNLVMIQPFAVPGRAGVEGEGGGPCGLL